MKIKIKVLNVDDGDSIIIHLSKENKNFVILIDGGHPNDSRKIIQELEPILKLTKKKAPDLIVGTHYDSDHIGGLLGILDNYKAEIHQLWIHQPKENVKLFLESLVDKSKKLDSYSIPNLRDTLYSERKVQMDLILKSIDQLKELLKKANDYQIKICEPFAGKCQILDWPEIKIIGPTESYYNELFEKKDLKDLIIEESDLVRQEEFLRSNLLKAPKANPCDKLSTVSNITNTNKASVIILVSIDSEKYLFTGDCGIESLKKIPDYETVLNNIFWLKIPHHGSINNISKELIELMKPIHAYNSGEKYEDAEVLDCFRSKGSNVKSTKVDGDLVFP